MKQLLTLRDLMLILNLSEATLRRRIAESRAGIGNFPKSVNHGVRRKLLFNPDEIELWAGCQQSVPAAKIESASQRSKRHQDALKRLRSKGVKVATQKHDQET